ncbi:transmembrane protein [Entophlyctis helioformis]|nr:transmembrane protein [Entophlyctis helioformis]
MVTADTMVPARFLVTTSHFMATIMAYMTRDGNIKTALPINSTVDYTAFSQSLTAAIAFSWILFVADFVGLFSGITMFSTRTNALHIAAHAAGTITLSFYISEGWHYLSYWYIFTFCSLLPGLVEIWLLLRTLLK